MKTQLAVVFCFFLGLAPPQPTAAQSVGGYIAGTIEDTASAPIPHMSVQVQELLVGDVTDELGRFLIGPVQPGTYTITASSIGFQRLHKKVLVRGGTTETVDFTFSEADVVLPGIEITGRRQNSYTSAYSFAGTKSAIAAFDLPQSLSTVTKELIDDQQVFGLAEVMKNIAGVHQNTSQNDIDIRGFRNHTGPSASGYRLINGLRSGFGYFSNPLLINIERVEVLKGPGTALFGAVNPGGTVNLVTKKPLITPRKALQFSTGSFNTLRTAFDLTGPLNESGTLLYRFNTGYEKTNTFRDFNNYTAFALAPTVTFAPTPNTLVNAELMYSAFDGFLTRGVAIPAQNLSDADAASSLAQPSDWYNVEDVYLNMSLYHRFSKSVSFNAAYLKFGLSEDLGEHRTLNRWRDRGAQLVSNIRYWERLEKTQTENVSGFFSIEREIGATRHNVNLGLDWVRYYTDGGTIWEARSQRVPVTREFTTNANEVVQVTEFEEEPLTFDLRNPVYRHRGNDIANYVFRQNRDIGDREDEYQTVGLYFQDYITLSRRLKALVGLRYEFYRDQHDFTLAENAGTQKQRVFVPRFGLVAGVSEQVNLYGHYSQGFVPIGPTFIHTPELYRPDGNDVPFEHETSELLEVGIKSAWYNGALLANLAFYQILKRNVLQPTGEVNSVGNDVLAQLGRVQSKGVELEISGSISANLLVNAHYAFNPTDVKDAEDSAENGQPLWGAPEHLAGLWIRYVIGAGKLKGLGVGAGMYHASSRRHRFLSASLESGDSFFGTWPAYTTLDAALYYRVNQFKLAVNFNNVLDKKYWIGGYDYLNAYPGAPFHVLTSIGYSF